jgi:DhnA family fructose-bisphosphate aldolase class Ia
MARHVASAFSHRGAPAMIVRLNWGTQYATQWGYKESRSVPLISAGDAVGLGADIVLVGMSIKTGSEAVDAENVAQVAACVAEARVVGVPIVGEVYPAGHEDIAPEARHEQIAIGCRIVAELGVDLVKTFHTGDRFSEIVRSTPVPVLALGAKKTPHEVDALELAATAVRDGARGVVFGRNVVGARSPERFLDALADVVKRGVDPAEAARKHDVA